MVQAPYEKSGEHKVLFDGTNWEDLDRLEGIAQFHFLQDDDYTDEPKKQCAFLASRFTGAALDWAVHEWGKKTSTFDDFATFVTSVREAFGIEGDGLSALRRVALEKLKWSTDVPLFFAEFDRLTLNLGITSQATKILLVRERMPETLKSSLALQGLDIQNYDTFRERLKTAWILDPKRAETIETIGEKKLPSKRPRCGRCRKRGHTAAECKAT